MTFCIVGTGRVARYTGLLLGLAGHECVCVYGRDVSKAGDLAQLLHCSRAEPLQEIGNISDFCLVSVSDHALPEIGLLLARYKGLVIHTAGSQPFDVFDYPNSAVLWPLFSIQPETEAGNADIPLIIDMDPDQGGLRLDKVLNNLPNKIIALNFEARRRLHLAAVFANNFSNHMQAIAEEWCLEHRLPFSLILPMLQDQVRALASASPVLLQTGPARRGDENTMALHRQMLGHSHPEWALLYEAISRSIENRYR